MLQGTFYIILANDYPQLSEGAGTSEYAVGYMRIIIFSNLAVTIYVSVLMRAHREH